MGDTTRRIAIALLPAILLTACGGDPADDRAGEREAPATRCTTSMGAEHVAGDLIVPEDATCELRGTAVDGRTFVDSNATLIATSAYLGEGVSAHGFRRVELRGGRVKGRPRDWRHDYGRDATKDRDWVFDGGRHLTITDGDPNGAYYVIQNYGRVQISGLNLDLGAIYCAGNVHKPRVSRISGETPGVLQGQCAGLRNFGDSDF